MPDSRSTPVDRVLQRLVNQTRRQGDKETRSASRRCQVPIRVACDTGSFTPGRSSKLTAVGGY